jgi:hypothetical protein
MRKNTDRKKDKKKKLKKITLILIAVLLFVGLLWLILYGITALLSGGREESADTSFFEPDYEENILEDQLYLSKNRMVYYLEYGSGEVVTSDNINNLPDCARFFDTYFKTVINGDYNKYRTFFTDNYIKENVLPERFTMQRIYDIEVDLFDKRQDADIVIETFVVRYKIMFNNGTFRSDVGSNVIKPLVFELYRTGDSVLINAIKEKKTVFE